MSVIIRWQWQWWEWVKVAMTTTCFKCKDKCCEKQKGKLRGKGRSRWSSWSDHLDGQVVNEKSCTEVDGLLKLLQSGVRKRGQRVRKEKIWAGILDGHGKKRSFSSVRLLRRAGKAAHWQLSCYWTLNEAQWLSSVTGHCRRRLRRESKS